MKGITTICWVPVTYQLLLQVLSSNNSSVIGHFLWTHDFYALSPLIALITQRRRCSQGCADEPTFREREKTREEKEEGEAVGEGREGEGKEGGGRKAGKEKRKTPFVVFLMYVA